MRGKRATAKVTKKSIADKIQRRKGDVSGWARGPADLTFRKSDSVVFSLRLTADELEEIRDRARAQGMGVSELVRRILFASKVRLRDGSVTLNAAEFPFVQFGRVQTSTTTPALIRCLPQSSAIVQTVAA